MTTEALLRLPEVKRLTGLSRTEIYRRMRAGEFPNSVALGARAVAWPLSSIQKFVEGRIRASREGAAR